MNVGKYWRDKKSFGWTLRDSGYRSTGVPSLLRVNNEVNTVFRDK